MTPTVEEFKVNYWTSEQVTELFAALSIAQQNIMGASKDATNPHFGSKYADLASVWDACRKPLTEQGFAVLQPVTADGPKVTITTLLAHKSGQWISAELTMTAEKPTPQGIGSAITYGRRYGLCAMVGISPEDDDGNAASDVSGRAKRAQAEVVETKTAKVPPKEPKSQLFDALKAFADMKKALGEKPYYYVLSANGFHKSNEITDETTTRSVYKQMVGVKKLVDAAANGEVLDGMNASLFAVLPDSSIAAIQREMRNKLAAAFGTEVGPQEFDEMRAASATNWEFVGKVRDALAEYNAKLGA